MKNVACNIIEEIFFEISQKSIFESSLPQSTKVFDSETIDYAIDTTGHTAAAVRTGVIPKDHSGNFYRISFNETWDFYMRLP